MNVGIITCHRAINYGAVLQAYALSHYIENKGHVVKIIDYAPKYLRCTHGNLFYRLIWKICHFPDFAKGDIGFASFNKRYIKKTKLYTSLSELKKNPPICDVYITGSDQVWNYAVDNGKDGSYFLEFVPQGKIKVSYAASIAQDEIIEPHASNFRKWLNDFNLISVREVTAANILDSIGITGVLTVSDPVYLLSAEEWSALADSTNSEIHSNYILLYAFNCTKECSEYAQKLSKSTGKQLVVINTMITDYFIKGDIHIWFRSPAYFVKLFKNADQVVTNSFHGLSFSILFKKPVHVFTKTTGGNSRLFDLLKDLSMKNCKDGGTVDYSKVYAVLNEKITFSKSVIDKILTYGK